MTKKTSAGTVALEVGAGLAAAGAAAAAAGYYFYGSDGAKKHRKLAAKWATDMKKEVVKEAKRLKDTDPKVFSAMVDRVAQAYKSADAVNLAELKRAASELKTNWDKVRREAKGVARKTVSRAKVAKKSVKKAVKKAVKKTAKKVAKKRK